MSAYREHLGAHLGYGGHVEQDRVICLCHGENGMHNAETSASRTRIARTRAAGSAPGRPPCATPNGGVQAANVGIGLSDAKFWARTKCARSLRHIGRQGDLPHPVVGLAGEDPRRRRRSPARGAGAPPAHGEQPNLGRLEHLTTSALHGSASSGDRRGYGFPNDSPVGDAVLSIGREGGASTP
jgi:hypothetical protein